MQLNSKDLHNLCQHAISAAIKAGEIISSYKDKTVSVNSKKAGANLASQVVTEVDHLCQDIILQTLLPTCKRYDLALLTEETPDDLTRFKKDYFWCIDPLDGTLPFIESIPGYSVSIALVSRQGISQLGVIFDPVEQTLYHAIKGQGAFRNGQPWKLKSTSSPGQTFTLITDRSFSQHSQFSKVLTELKYFTSAIGYADFDSCMQGGAAMNACWVLEKYHACYFKFPKIEEGGGSLWDYAATACLFQELGAVANDIFGHSLNLNRIDSTFMNHQGVLYTSNTELAKRIISLYADLKLQL